MTSRVGQLRAQKHRKQKPGESIKSFLATSSDNESDFAALDVSQVQPYSFELYELDSNAESAYSGSDMELDTAESLDVKGDFDRLQNTE